MEDFRWRSFKREVPAIGEEVLAYYPKTKGHAALMCNQIFRPVDLASVNGPTHWRPLPKPPAIWSE